MVARDLTVGMTTTPGGSWVQVEREALERSAALTLSNPRAAALMQIIIARMGRHNALVASQKTLARLAGCSDRTIRTALKVLKEGNWIEVRQIGPTGTANAYIVNDRVAWSGKRDGIRYSMFSAAVLIADDEQPDSAELGSQPPLMRFPTMYPGERQLPTGEGLPPPSQPSLPSMEPDLPALRQIEDEQIEPDWVDQQNKKAR